ncbi:MAG: hypothetical protein EBS19_06330, partial [Spirochaetia bacterium]|nr:hypothetical protein [Spirochaetia bacterium]
MNLKYFNEKSAYDAGITFFESTLERSLKSVATREISLSKFLKEQIQSGKPFEKVVDTGFFLGTFRDIDTNLIASKPIDLEEEIKK